MAATATELRRIYINLFHGPDDQTRLRSLQEALAPIDREAATSREEADELLFELNGGQDPELSFTQLECLKTILSAPVFAPLVPAADERPEVRAHLSRFYKTLFAETDLTHLRALQRAAFDYDKFRTDRKRTEVLQLLHDVDPAGPWDDGHIEALEALLVQDITFKQIAPFQVTGDFW